MSSSIQGPVLYVYNLYYQGRQELGPTSSWELTWKNSLSSFFGENVNFFNPDIFGTQSSSESDELLLRYVDSVKPSLLVMIYHNGAKWKRDFISIKTLRTLQGKTKIVSIWGDIQLPSQRSLMRKISNYVDLNLCTASSAAVMRLGLSTSTKYVPVPISDPKQENKCDCGKLISFAGGVKDNRGKVLNYLIKNGAEIHLGGGEGANTLTREDYLTLLGHDMTISFGGSSFESLTNARTFEALSQDALLLEKWGSETCKLLIPYVDYVPWFNKRDLLDKLEHYKENLVVASAISASGNGRLKEFSSERLWQVVLAKLFNNQDFDFVSNLNLNLDNIPYWYKKKAQIMNLVASNPKLDILFVILYRARFFRYILTSLFIRLFAKVKNFVRLSLRTKRPA